MRFSLKACVPRVSQLCKVTVCLSLTLPSALLAAPVDELLPANSSLLAPAESSSREERDEISLLQSRDENAIVSIGDLTALPDEEASSSSDLTMPSELLQQRFENGKIHVERYVTEDKDGNLVNHGPYKEFDVAGTLVRSGSFALGKLDGKWSQLISVEKAQALSSKMDPGFRPPFKSEATFRDGVIDGVWTVADSKGNPVFVWQFQRGKRENVSTWFDSRRAMVLETMYSADIANGPSTQMVSGQRDPKKVFYDHGRLVQSKINWFEKGKKRSEETLLAPAADRLVAHDWWNSRVESEPLPEGVSIRQGLYTAWHPNGQKSVEGHFSDGVANGEFQWWYANGQLQSRGYYEEGKSLGEWVWYHANGMKKMEGSYDNGVQVGQWSSWDTEGRLELRALASDFPVIEQKVDVEEEMIVPSKQFQLSQAPTSVRRPVFRPASTRKR